MKTGLGGGTWSWWSFGGNLDRLIMEQVNHCARGSETGGQLSAQMERANYQV